MTRHDAERKIKILDYIAATLRARIVDQDVMFRIDERRELVRG